MTLSIEGLVENLETRLERLAADPVTLVCLLLAANALVEPYRGLDHDSRLYAVQILERIHPGSFAADLYLRYGSQDKYSVFTIVIAPLVQLCGLHVTFFCVYLASKALLFTSLLRLTRVLISSNLAFILALVHLAIVPVAFGGNEIFHVNESFLTPRLPSCALVLFALERMLAGRRAVVALLLLGAFALHPLMAVGGILTAGLWWLALRCTTRQLAWLALAAAAITALLTGLEPVGDRLFGHMDDVWRTINLQMCFYIRPARWSWDDWVRIALGSGLTVWAASHSPDRRQGTFWAAVLASAFIGLIGSLIAVNSHYFLLIQASPYRTLWLLELLAVPAGYGLAACLWNCGSQPYRSASLVVVLLLTFDWDRHLWASACLFLLALLGFAVLFRGISRAPRDPGWLWLSTRSAFLCTSLVLAGFSVVKLADWFRARPSGDFDVHPASIATNVYLCLFTLPLLMLFLLLCHHLSKSLDRASRYRLSLLAVCAGYQFLVVSAPYNDWYARHFDVHHRRVQCVGSALSNLAAGRSKPLTVYWPTSVNDIWFGTGNNAFYSTMQMSGCGFNRGTAVEGYRRLALALPFEFEKLRIFGPENEWMIALAGLFPARSPLLTPVEKDLIHLCEDSELDFIVLGQRFKDLYCATDGSVYLYDCAQLRNLLPEAPDRGRVSLTGGFPSRMIRPREEKARSR